jgi:hypothetical protein
MFAFELIKDVVKLALISAALYFTLGAYVRGRQPAWSAFWKSRRFGVLLGLVSGGRRDQGRRRRGEQRVGAG